jgi:glycosyltransferase involved in cell wall biosynthesis
MPHDTPAISLVIPAYNEAARIATTVLEAVEYFRDRQLSHEIIVSADGTDGTREAAQQLTAAHPNIRVIGSPQRRGKGNGIRQAVRIATGDLIGFSDADNKTPITEFDKIEPLLRQGTEVVIGSRGLRESRIERAQPLYRRVGSRGFALVMHTVVGLPGIADTQCGFKFFQGRVAHDLFRRQQIDGYMFDVEILFIARQRGYRIEEVPVRWRDDGDSRLNLVMGNLRNMRDVLSIRWRHRQLGHDSDLVSEPVSRSDS